MEGKGAWGTAIRSKSVPRPSVRSFVRFFVSSSIRELSVKPLWKCSEGTVYGSGGEDGSGMSRFLLRLFLVIPGGEECEIMNEPVRSDFFFVGVALPLSLLRARDNRRDLRLQRKKELIHALRVISIVSSLLFFVAVPY